MQVIEEDCATDNYTMLLNCLDIHKTACSLQELPMVYEKSPDASCGCEVEQL